MIKKLKTALGTWDVYSAKIIDINKGDEDDFGLCVAKRMHIVIRDDLSPDMERQTLLHELVHVIETQCGIQLPETTVDSFATHLLYILRNNPHLLAYLLNERKK
jgi:Zn-dependent peptidase ImmA (M78 family)